MSWYFRLVVAWAPCQCQCLPRRPSKRKSGVEGDDDLSSLPCLGGVCQREDIFDETAAAGDATTDLLVEGLEALLGRRRRYSIGVGQRSSNQELKSGEKS